MRRSNCSRSRSGVVAVTLWVLAACSGRPEPTPSSEPTPSGSRATSNTVPALPSAGNAGPAELTAAPKATGGAAPLSPADEGADLIAPTLELFRVAACGDAGGVPARF